MSEAVTTQADIVNRSFTLREAAPYLGIKPRVIRKRIADKLLTARRDGKYIVIDGDEIIRYKAARPDVSLPAVGSPGQH